MQKSIKAEALVSGDGPDSNMGRLDCKNASKIAFESLRRDADVFVTISDAAASAATEKLAKYGIETTPSGAAGFAGLALLSLSAEDRAMIIISEGPENG
ncbi:hypothetical protein IMCC3135_21180 [Granulosicoccus antarcticus IMCC3135]|uniref:Tryptophan synthase beta chain-like PALP domain-containing protein n=1 Tax=Granulosicoccus antarcticus IMCC3135 TaxID=1192854 RepID=A0A2Z2NSS4_9GAMM|nr:hypothetical protein IMCC3135_21180 [Granulosicoccus antarcticus IMCC3135]